MCQKLSILHQRHGRISFSCQRIIGWRFCFYRCMRRRNDDRCFCGVVWCLHMNNIAKIRRRRHHPIGRDNSTRQLKPMCVATFWIRFFKDSYCQAFDFMSTTWFLHLPNSFYVRLETSILHKRKLKISRFCKIKVRKGRPKSSNDLKKKGKLLDEFMISSQNKTGGGHLQEHF